METENTFVTYAAKRESGKWLNKNDPDVKRFLEKGEVPASILAMMNGNNKLDSLDFLNELKFKFPVGDEVEQGDFHVIAEPVKYFRAKPLNTHGDPECQIPVWKDLLRNLVWGFILYYIFIRGNVPVCLAQWCVSRTMPILLALLFIGYLTAPPPPQPSTTFIQNKLRCPVLMQFETLKDWKQQGKMRWH